MQPIASALADPDAVATNARNDLTPAQRAALRSCLPGTTGDWFTLAFATALLGFVLYHGQIVLLFFRAKDPLPSTEHLFGHTFTIPGFHLLALLIIGAWALTFFTHLATFIDRIRASNELKPGHVACTDGTIAWDRHAYVALLPGRRQPLRAWNELGIDGCPPGPYRFWHLRHGGWLLSLQPLGFMDARTGQAGERGALIGALANANGFLPDALDTNRAGCLSASQVRGLARGEKARLRWQLAISIGFIMAAPAFWYYGDPSPAFLCACAGLYLYVQSLRQPTYSTLDKDLADGRVLVVEGEARKAHRRTFSLLASVIGGDGDGTTDYYYYDIAGQRFPTSETAYHALVDGVAYRFFYLPRSRTIVNIEPLG